MSSSAIRKFPFFAAKKRGDFRDGCAYTFGFAFHFRRVATTSMCPPGKKILRNEYDSEKSYSETQKEMKSHGVTPRQARVRGGFEVATPSEWAPSSRRIVAMSQRPFSAATDNGTARAAAPAHDPDSFAFRMRSLKKRVSESVFGHYFHGLPSHENMRVK